MLGSFWSRVTVGIAVLVGIAGLSYVLAGAAAPPRGRRRWSSSPPTASSSSPSAIASGCTSAK